eukprot:364198-Chlamydomonas_euryale.AAC.15
MCVHAWYEFDLTEPLATGDLHAPSLHARSAARTSQVWHLHAHTRAPHCTRHTLAARRRPPGCGCAPVEDIRRCCRRLEAGRFDQYRHHHWLTAYHTLALPAGALCRPDCHPHPPHRLSGP